MLHDHMGRGPFLAGDHVDRPERQGRLLTPTQLSTHLACAHYTQLEHKRHVGELEVEFMPDPRLEAMRLRGAERERTYIGRLGHDFIDLRESRDPGATLAAMRKGANAIVQAPLGNGVFSGIADVLLRVEVPSALLQSAGC